MGYAGDRLGRRHPLWTISFLAIRWLGLAQKVWFLEERWSGGAPAGGRNRNPISFRRTADGDGANHPQLPAQRVYDGVPGDRHGAAGGGVNLSRDFVFGAPPCG